MWRLQERSAVCVAEDGAPIAAESLPHPYGTGERAGDGIHIIPITGRGEPLGILVVVRDEAPVEGEERLAMEAIANLVAGAILAGEEARRFAEEVSARTRELEAQHRFIERIVDSLPVGLYVVDREYRVHAWNRTREIGLQGVLREEAIGRTIFEILRRQPADLLRHEFDEVFRAGEMIQIETVSSASGEPRIYRVSKIPMRINDAAVTHVITIGEDITDWKRAQQRMAAAEKLAALGQLAAGVMHEINNPMATIGACAESIALQLQDEGVPAALREALQEFCQIIEHEVHRCKRIVDGLLDFSRPQGHEKSAVGVDDVVEQALFLVKHHPRFKHVTVETVLEGREAGTVHGNREQLVQVIMALLLNGADAMEAEGTIRVSTRVRAGRAQEAVVEVMDHGHGISASELDKVFDPFYTTKPPGRGTGLGLSICYGIVADHGGRIEVESTVGKGSTFRVCLPMARSEHAREEAAT